MKVSIPRWITLSGTEQAAAEPRLMLNVSKSRSILFGYSFVTSSIAVCKTHTRQTRVMQAIRLMHKHTSKSRRFLKNKSGPMLMLI